MQDVEAVFHFCLLLITSGNLFLIEPRSEKTGLRGFRPGPTQTVVLRKPVFGVSDLVRHKPVCAVTKVG